MRTTSASGKTAKCSEAIENLYVLDRSQRRLFTL
jgi:hypothetical protein